MALFLRSLLHLNIMMQEHVIAFAGLSASHAS